MHKEILSSKQNELLNVVKYFSSKDFYLAGGTALSLQLGYRESIDFDLFTYEKFNNEDIYKQIKDLQFNNEDFNIVIDKLDEYTFFLKGVKFTFLRYPFLVKNIIREEEILLTNPLAIGAMKAYALGRRAKWKDYVDIYMLLQKYSLLDIISEAEEIFGSLFSKKMFLQQICYFNDIDYSEEITWKIPNHKSDSDIKSFLQKISTTNI